MCLYEFIFYDEIVLEINFIHTREKRNAVIIDFVIEFNWKKYYLLILKIYL